MIIVLLEPRDWNHAPDRLIDGDRRRTFSFSPITACTDMDSQTETSSSSPSAPISKNLLRLRAMAVHHHHTIISIQGALEPVVIILSVQSCICCSCRASKRASQPGSFRPCGVHVFCDCNHIGGDDMTLQNFYWSSLYLTDTELGGACEVSPECQGSYFQKRAEQRSSCTRNGPLPRQWVSGDRQTA